MTYVEQALKLRPIIIEASKSLPDDEAYSAPQLFPMWDGNGKAYAVSDRVQYKEVLYKCVQAHTSQEDWTPDAAISLWVAVPDPAIEWPEWKQPAGAHDAYMKGDKVTYEDKHWISDIDNNVYVPGVYGWNEAE